MATTVRELIVHWGMSVDSGPLKKLEAGIGAIATAAKVTAGVVAGAAGALFGLAEGARRTIDDLDETAQSVGLNTQFFTEFTAAASLGGATMQDTAQAAGVLSRKIIEAKEGSKEARDAFADLGISQEDLNRLPTEAIIAKIADGMRDVEDPAKRVALAQELLGRGGKRLIPTLVGGAAAMAKLGDEAREFGLVPGPAAVEAANEMEHAMARARGIVGGMALTVGTKLMPVVTDIADRFTAWAKENRGLILTKVDAFVDGLKIVVEAAWDATVGFVGAMKDLVGWFRESPGAFALLKGALAGLLAAMIAQKVLAFAEALRGLRVVMSALNVAMAANPVGLLITLLAVLVALWVANWDEIREVSLFAWETIKEAGRDALAFLSGIWTSIASTAIDAWDGMKLAFTDTVTAFKNAWGQVADWFEQTITKPIKKAFSFTPTGAMLDMLGIGGGGDGKSPGRPGSPESRIGLVPSAVSFGRGGVGAGARTVTVHAPITIHAAPGMSAAEKDDLESRVRRAARQVFESEARQVLAEMP